MANSRPSERARRVFLGEMAVLLFCSGLSGIVLQICWFREFRLSFGATAMASAAVMAAFIAGLGSGNATIGRFADGSRRPLLGYAVAEVAIALTAAASPFIVDACRQMFFACGGEASLGAAAASIARFAIVLAAIALPTFAMGGTLPLAVRAAVPVADAARRRVAILYVANTLGGVVGALLTTFALIEATGTRATLWMACGLNLCLAAVGFVLARWEQPQRVDSSSQAEPSRNGSRAETMLLALAAGAGFVFFSMELVWYRMLGPILGGTTFTFGLILAVALLGIGIGASAYPIVFARRTPALEDLAASCLWEAVGLAVPFALGDRIAVLAATLRDSGTTNFAVEVAGWAVVAGIVVGPAAIVSGFQFPLIVGLLGGGSRRVGHHVGDATAWNAAGGILGSLAGGFGLLPLLSAPGVWRATAGGLVVIGVALLVASQRPVASIAWPMTRFAPRRIGLAAVFHAVVAVAVVALLACEGPTAVWRHGSIGAGRGFVANKPDANRMREWTNARRRCLRWEADGVEASIGIVDSDGLSFYVNGKSDGHAVHDAGTQIGLGVIGAALHPAPRTAFVIGLGTGETAGWLAEVDGVERVDVAEIEPAVFEMAARCKQVNHDVVNHSKVRIAYDDAREMLLAGRSRYDLIVCEPSNPFRSGVANLFTKELYEATLSRLEADGMFLQWLQAYEVDRDTFRTVLATFVAVFPHVEMWQTITNDVVLLGCRRQPSVDSATIRRRVEGRPFDRAFAAGWHVTGLEGLLSRHIGGPRLVADLLGELPTMINTDDRNAVEFGFAKTLGRRGLMSSVDLQDRSHTIGDDRYPLEASEGEKEIDWRDVELTRQWELAMAEGAVDRMGEPSRAWIEDEVVVRYANGDVPGMLRAWEARGSGPACLTEASVIARGYAELGDQRAIALIERVRAALPAEADVLTAKLASARGDSRRAAASLCAAFDGLRREPWMMPGLREHAFAMADGLSRTTPAVSLALLQALSEPFAVDVARESRISCCSRVAEVLGPGETVRYVELFEPFVPWKLPFLEFRWKTYAAVGHPFAVRAARDVETFKRQAAEKHATETAIRRETK